MKLLDISYYFLNTAKWLWGGSTSNIGPIPATIIAWKLDPNMAVILTILVVLAFGVVYAIYKIIAELLHALREVPDQRVHQNVFERVVLGYGAGTIGLFFWFLFEILKIIRHIVAN
ncbi:unnamed protein product [Rotaria magnacalcarata]|uniref:Uncharacterized protein n=1 Tax=Rotaria magnacalcarata TaxID=392030 RepID=A0A816ZAQ8_9BILA|nr:unnamed protein product [Rotaria magnacalcarata]